MNFPHRSDMPGSVRTAATALGLVLGAVGIPAAAQDAPAGGSDRISLSFAEETAPAARISLSFLDWPDGAPETAPDAAIRLRFGPAGMQEGAAATGEAAEEVAPSRELRLASLWPVEADRARAGRLRLSGERDGAEVLLIAAPGAIPEALVLSTVSSAYVAPAGSSLRVTMDGREIGTIRPENIAGPAGARLALPEGLLQPGVNRLRIEAVHAHRYACGGDAAYDLWTDLDLSASGAAFDPAALRPGGAGFLAQLAAARGDGRPVVFHRPADGALDAAALQISQRLGRLTGGGFEIEAAGAARPVTPEDVAVILRSGPSADLQIRVDAAGAALIVQVGPNGLPDLDAALGSGFDAAPLPSLATGREVTLSELGFEPGPVTDHLWSENLAFALPTDWHLATNIRSELTLRFANAEGLPEGARLRVLVNGEPVRLVPLHEVLHTPATPLAVRFSSALLQAGRNVLGFEVFVPGDPDDAPCPREAAVHVDIDPGSTLFVPEAPRMSLVGLADQLDGLGPDALLPALRAASDAAAAGAILQLATALPEPPADSISNRLMVSGGDGVDPASFGTLWSSRELLRTALRQAPALPEVAPEVTVADAPAATPATTRMSLLAGPEIAARARSNLAALRGFLTDLVFPDPKRDLATWMEAHQGQALLYQLDAGDPNGLHLVLAPEARPGEVAAGLDRALRREVPLRGQAALLGWDGEWVGWTDKGRLPQLHETLRLGNLRDVAGNYASARPIWFVAAILGLTLLSVLAASSFLLSTRGRR